MKFKSVFCLLFVLLLSVGGVDAAIEVRVDDGMPLSPIIDDDGRMLVRTAFPLRVVTLAPALTELVYAAGAEKKLVGVSAYSDFPESARHRPQVADANGVSFESLLAVKPDMVLAWKGGTKSLDIARIEALGVPVFVVDIRTLADVPRVVRVLGTLLGRPKFADTPQQFASAFEATLAKMQVEHKDKLKVKVFFEVAQLPLMTVNRNHFISETMRLCGAENIFADLSQTVAEPSREELLKRGAEAILRAASITKDPSRDSALYGGLPAYRNGRIYPLNGDWILRPGPRVLLAAEQICAAMDRLRAEDQNSSRNRK